MNILRASARICIILDRGIAVEMMLVLVTNNNITVALVVYAQLSTMFTPMIATVCLGI